jgi:hypothetical protein
MHSNISRRDRERAPQADRPATLEKQILQDDVARRNLSAPLGGGWWWRGSGSGTRSRLPAPRCCAGRAADSTGTTSRWASRRSRLANELQRCACLRLRTPKWRASDNEWAS